MQPQELLGITGEHAPTREQLEQDAAQRVHVRRAAHVVHLVLDLLGCHVARSAGAGVGRELHGLGAVEALVVGILLEPGEAKIEDVDLGRVPRHLFDQHVGGLEITVDDPARVGVGQGAQDLIERMPDQLEAVGGLGQVVERDAADEVHGEEGGAVLELPEVLRANDAGVVQGGQSARLFVEPHDVLGRELALRRDHALERDLVPSGDVFAPIDDAHSAFTQDADHLVAIGEDVAGQDRARCAQRSDLLHRHAEDGSLFERCRARDARGRAVVLDFRLGLYRRRVARQVRRGVGYALHRGRRSTVRRRRDARKRPVLR